MFRLGLAISLFIFFLRISPSFAGGNEKVERPALVVGLVLDQMRWDYLYRYYEGFGDKGFKRLMREGFNCHQTKISHIPSFTAPGHAGIYTGTVPAVHGIVSNNWLDPRTGRKWYCTEDTSVLPVGGSWKAGRMSPANMKTTTITDELKLATQFRSRVYGIALKDRGGILPAGHLADGAFWFDDSTGNFISSTFYNNQLPEWLNQFNQRRLADSLMSQPWELIYSQDRYKASFPDSSKYEGLMPGETASVFPHKVSTYNRLRYLPAGNTLSLEMAKACVRGVNLGKGEATDFLCLSLSTTDYAGHMYAPGSLELEDMYLRLDREIADLLNFFDSWVGKGNYLFFLTADHGSAYNAQMMQDFSIPAGNSSGKAMLAAINAYIFEKFGVGNSVLTLDNYQVYLNEPELSAPSLRSDIRKAIFEWLADRDEIAYVIDLENQIPSMAPEKIREMVVNGHFKHRSGSIQFILQPGWYFGYAPTGSTHGIWHPYDTHIPLVWYGWNIPRGGTYAPVFMPDIAPTLSALLKIPQPNGCTGVVIRDLFR